MKIVKILLIIGIFLAMIPHSIALEYPKPVGYVNDYAGKLTPDQVLKLDNELKDFDNKTTIEFAVVTVQSLGGLNIEAYTMGLMNKWGVGKKGKDNGVMLLVAPNERKVRIGTGSGMGQALSDSDANNIIQNDIIPYFKEGNMSGGIIAGAESIMRHLSGQSGQSGVPVGTIDRQNVQPSLSDQDIKHIIIVVFAIIGMFIILLTGNWIWNKNNIKKKNIALFKKLKINTYNTLLEIYQKVELTLVMLEQNNPKSVWEDLKDEYNNIDFTYIGKELDTIQQECNKILSSSEVNEKLHSIEKEINEYIKICEKIEERQNEVIKAKEKSNQLIKELPEYIENIKEILKHQDVSAKTKGMIDSVNKNFIDVKNENNSNIDWLQTFSKLDSISKALNNIKSRAEQDIDSAADARIRGPEILKKLPDLIEKLERKLSSSGSRKARTLFADAKNKYGEAQRLSNAGSPNLLDVYFMAIMADSLLNQAQSSHTHYHESSQSSQSSSSSYSNSNFGGFGGGGSSGGGGTGGW